MILQSTDKKGFKSGEEVTEPGTNAEAQTCSVCFLTSR